MPMRQIAPLFIVLLFATVALVSWQSNLAADKETQPAPSIQPVEADVHEFMEYAFEPVFEVLKEAMQSEPADKAGWRPIKAGGLILAENGNLLMMRPPLEDRQKVAEWNRLSAALRADAKQLYLAGKKRDFDDAKSKYLIMVKRCNACHDRFADGEHQQEP